MSAIKHAFRANSGIFYFRYTLPKSLRQLGAFPRKSIYLSLKTHDLKEANLMSKALWVELQMAMNSKNKKDKSATLPDIHARLKRYRDYIADADEHEQKTVYWGNPEFEEILEIHEKDLRQLASAGLLEELDGNFSNLTKLTARAENIHNRIKQGRIDYITDQTINNAKRDLAGESYQSQSNGKRRNDTSETTLQNILDEYLDKNDVDDVKWSVKNYSKEKGHFQFLIDSIGDIPVHEFDEKGLRDFLKALEKRTRRLGGKQVPISAKTRNEYIATCRRVFEFAEARYASIQKNLFANKSIFYKANETKRHPFTVADLKAMFSHPTYVAGAFRHPYQYWIPLLGLFTGARANELAQLHVDDIMIKNGIPCISLNTNTTDKGLKNKGSDRFVPLHPKLIELGFQGFVDLLRTKPARWKDENGYYRLFQGLTLDKTRGGYQKNLSRWFNGSFNKKTKKYSGFKHDAGIEISEEYKKDFHSFRHTCSTALDNAGVPPNIAYRITGHTTDEAIKKLYVSAGGQYRHALEIKIMYEEICKLDFDEALSNVKPFFKIGGDKKCLNKKRL